MDRTASPWKEAMTAARKGESGRENVNSRCHPAKRTETAGNYSVIRKRKWVVLGVVLYTSMMMFISAHQSRKTA
jgi:hypothetical protein